MFISKIILALAAPLFCLALATSLARADIPRPFDERATARLVVAALKKADPDIKINIGIRRFSISTPLPNWQAYEFRLDKLHAQLRGEPSGERREDILNAYIAEQIAYVNGVLAGKIKTLRDRLEEFEPTSVLPVLTAVDPDNAWKTSRSTQMPFAGNIVVMWVQDRSAEIKAGHLIIGPISTKMARKLNLDWVRLQRLGLANLDHRLSQVTERRDGRFRNLSLDGQLGTSLMLANRYWDALSRNGHVVTVAVPREDTLIMITDADVAEIAQLREISQNIYALTQVSPRLSTDLFRWTGNGWQALPP